MESNIKDKVVFASPHSEEGARLRRWSLCTQTGNQNSGGARRIWRLDGVRIYSMAGPLYLIDGAGRVAYKSRRVRSASKRKN